MMASGSDSSGASTLGDSDSSGDDGTTGPFSTTGFETEGFDIGCDKIDFLFVVDNHTGGLGALTSLKNSLPGFVSNITTHLPGHDLNFMVVDTDDQWGSEPCEDKCQLYGHCQPWWPDYACDVALTSCDTHWGAGIVIPSGSDTPCNVKPGARYMTNENLNTLEQDLWCLLNVGSHGNGLQQQAKALISSLLPSNNNPGDCNEGFLRDDALLVVTLVTHMPDFVSSGEPPDWYQQIVTAKGGNSDAIVFLGLLDDSEDKPFNVCDQPQFDPDQRLQKLVDMFPYSITGSVCSTSYTPFFNDAFGIINDACEELIPG